MPRDQIKEVREIAIMKGKDPMDFVAGISYKQSVNVTKFLKVDSLLVDTYHFVESTWKAEVAELGWSGVILLLSQLSKGEDFNEAIEATIKIQLATFKSDMFIHVTANQILNKTNIGRGIIKKYGMQGADIGVAGLSLVVNNHRDFQLFFNGQISGKRLTKQLTASSISTWVTSKVSAKVGASQLVKNLGGSALGISCLPGLVIGGLVSNVVYDVVSDALRGISKKDMEGMERIFNKQFEILAKEYLLFDNEIEGIYVYFKNEELVEELFLEMYRSEDNFLVATHFIMSRIVEIYNNRALITLN